MAFSYSNNNLSNKFKNTADKGYTELAQMMDVGNWNQTFLFDIPYTSPLAPNKNNAVGVGERGMIHAFDYSGKHFYCVDSSKGWQKSPYVLKDDLGVTEYNAGKTINISGKLSDIGKWLQTNGVTARWMSARVDPINTDGYFGKSTFSILWQCSSADYGWCILMSDNSKMVVFGRNTGMALVCPFSIRSIITSYR